MSADCCQPAQMNAYRKSAYKPNKKSEYQQYLWQLSWSYTPESVPQHSMNRCKPRVVQGLYSHLHPSTLYDDGSALGIKYYGNYAMRKSRPPVMLPPMPMTAPAALTGGWASTRRQPFPTRL
eukprot:CAMPEP_0181181878 /NCGR_PEP_ID=MMETSP1096-20121128/7574_1 /TAXON_ID=156174 ORGANISM="Chrysochromulina ericina, Strain CCMP281" /NCGR_SAMPLE_ID=MMETSP1096 /ASSEMBLY_ACC=CAM_ASM_000453 /LENGTH=121 /DNA_ID=CAMNT_0023270415 /DNA_START=84 /DNA_END=449 /DNA_ORIENTATION=+